MSGKTKILISDVMSPRAAEILGGIDSFEVVVRSQISGPNDIEQIASEYDAILVRSATKIRRDIIESSPKLKLVGRAGIGVDNVDIVAASENGVTVMNTPFGNAITTAEHAISMMMSISRHIPAATVSMQAGRWDKKLFKGRQVTGKTLGVVGAGNIGAIVIDRAQGLRMNVIASDPFLSDERAAELGVRSVSLDELLQSSDYITIHTPLLAATKHIIGADAFRLMKPTAYLIHCARGGIVDEAALISALNDGELAGAALDVYETEPLPGDHPLRTTPRLVLTPHLGASTFEAQEAVAVQVAEQTVAFFTEGEKINALN